MIWLIGLAVIAVLVVCYLVGRQAIRKDRENALEARIDQARLDDALKPRILDAQSDSARPGGGQRDARETIALANAFHGHFTNGGFDSLLAAMQAREQSLRSMCDALEAVGAGPIAPMLREAAAADERYHREDDASEAAIGSDEHQQRVKAHLEEMRRLEAEVDRLGLDVGALSRDYAGRNGV